MAARMVVTVRSRLTQQAQTDRAGLYSIVDTIRYMYVHALRVVCCICVVSRLAVLAHPYSLLLTLSRACYDWCRVLSFDL